MRLVSYLINTKSGLEGEPATFYDYILAKNGLFIRASNRWLEATIPIAQAVVRGLQPVDRMLHLSHGKVPTRLLNLAVDIMLTDCDNERFLAITWEGEYRLRMPEQEYQAGGVRYTCHPETVMDIHSHGKMPPFWSGADNADEQGLRIYVVVGKLPTPEILLRVGVYGYFDELYIDEVFA